MAKPKKTESSTEVVELRTGRVEFAIVGITPMIYNAMSLKAKQSLLIPAPRKNAAERLSTLKHNPPEEYVASTYRHVDDKHPTRLYFPGGGVKRSMMNAAIRMPGMKKTETGQLLWINERDVDIFGIPQIYLAVTRSADMNRTPDVRTRAIVPEWAARFSVTYVKPQFSDKQVVNLLAAAGLLCGLGDNRQEKGGGNGQFKIVSTTDKDFKAIVAAGGRKAQDTALEEPSPFDLETQQLLAIFDREVAKMGDRLNINTAANDTTDEEEGEDEVRAA